VGVGRGAHVFPILTNKPIWQERDRIANVDKKRPRPKNPKTPTRAQPLTIPRNLPNSPNKKKNADALKIAEK
jgi:hypothetical protein